MLTDPRSDDAAMLGAQRDIAIVRQPSNNVAYLAMNVEKKPFDNVLVRRAVAQAIDTPGDRARALRTGNASSATTGRRAECSARTNACKLWPHDVAAAKTAAGAKPGFPHGFATTLYLPTSPRPVHAGSAAAGRGDSSRPQGSRDRRDARAARVRRVPGKIQNGEHAMCLIGWSGDNGDPDNFYYTLLDQDSARQAVRAELLVLARSAVPPLDARRPALGRTRAERARDLPAGRAARARSGARDPDRCTRRCPLALRESVRGFVPSPDTRIPLRTDERRGPDARRLSVLQDRPQGDQRRRKYCATNTSSRFTTSIRRRRRTCWSSRPCTPSISRSSPRQGNAAAAARLLAAAAEIGTRFGPGRLPGGDERGPRRRPDASSTSTPTSWPAAPCAGRPGSSRRPWHLTEGAFRASVTSRASVGF